MTINSSPPSAAYMHQLIGSASVQIMACRLFGAKQLSKPMLGYCHLDPYNKLQWKFNQNVKIFIHEDAYEKIICEFCPGGDELICYWYVLPDCITNFCYLLWNFWQWVIRSNMALSQRTHDVMITSLLRQNDVAMSFWRNNDVVITSCVDWDSISNRVVQ